MARRLNSAIAVIRAAGGQNAVARRFGVDYRVVWNWTDRGAFPPDSYCAWQQILGEIGCDAPDTLWQQRELVA